MGLVMHTCSNYSATGSDLAVLARALIASMLGFSALGLLILTVAELLYLESAASIAAVKRLS
jgi:hypothetical protein